MKQKRLCYSETCKLSSKLIVEFFPWDDIDIDIRSEQTQTQKQSKCNNVRSHFRLFSVTQQFFSSSQFKRRNSNVEKKR